MKKSITLFIILYGIILSVAAQDWIVPADKKGKLSPYSFTDETRKSGEQLYILYCKSCHGTPGMANFQATLTPLPPDPVSDKFQNNLDGELFFKISHGRGQMPAFKNSLSSNDLWNLISYVRNFNKKYIQAVAAVIKSTAYPDAEIIVRLAGGPAKDQITLKASAVGNNASVPVSGAGVNLFVKRYFGRMRIDEEKTTDNTGTAVFAIPSDLPADTAGNLHVVALFSDEDAFGSSGKDTVINAGTPVVPVSLTEKRAMWNVVRKAPVWIILTFTLGVLGVWGFIILIMLRLRDIFVIGSHLTAIPPQNETIK